MSAFVLDNSVCMRWCLGSDALGYADGILLRLVNGDQAVVPSLWPYEVISVLAKAHRKGTLTAAMARDFISDLQNMDIVVADAGLKDIFADVYRVAKRYQLTGYDAAYLELSQRRGIPIATLDEELRRAARESGVPLV